MKYTSDEEAFKLVKRIYLIHMRERNLPKPERKIKNENKNLEDEGNEKTNLEENF